jgi:hypothetical protein
MEIIIRGSKKAAEDKVPAAPYYCAGGKVMRIF